MSSGKSVGSIVWKYFEQKTEKDKKVTECQLCKTVLAYHGGTTAMRTHLTHKHPSVSLNSQLSAGSHVKAQVQATLSHSWGALQKKALPKSKSEEITRNIALMCATDVRPLSIVEGNGFRRLLYSLNPKYKVPCRNTIAKYIHKIYDDGKSDIIKDMNGLPVSLTSDLWRSTANDGYISLTGHFDQNWKLCAKTLASRRMEDRHTGKNIAQAINEICQDFKIGKVGCLVTDNAANMSVAAKDHAGCFAHTFQLCVEDGLKMPAINKALGAGRKLVSHFNKSVIS